MINNVKKKDIEKLIEMAMRRENLPLMSVMTGGSGYSEWIREADPQISEDRLICGFLKTFNYEQIQTLETIMYVGRDNDNEIFDRDPEVIFNEKMKQLAWTNIIEIEIDTILSKRPLANYLKEGMRILKF